MRSCVVAAALCGLVLPACGDSNGELRLVGSVERTEIELVAPVSEVIIAIHVERGERVEVGQEVLHLDPVLAEVDVTRADAALAVARTAVAVARHDLERSRQLRSGRVASDQELERAELGFEEAQAREREALALLAAAMKRRDDRTLVAPMSGIVDQIPFDRGERVPAGAVLAVLLSDDAPWVRVWIPETSVARVGPGTPAAVHIDGLGPLRGSVVDVAREPEFTPHYALTERDRVHLVYETRVRIDDAPASLRPGVPASVELFPDGTLPDGLP